ncbi:hypothetical protein BD779DRAFT_1001648 [Infundibulicybe gibba]|nr:hypothetical protein BD779DRAFT_1001648 [Infundibulicybe gibba]
MYNVTERTFCCTLRTGIVNPGLHSSGRNSFVGIPLRCRLVASPVVKPIYSCLLPGKAPDISWAMKRARLINESGFTSTAPIEDPQRSKTHGLSEITRAGGSWIFCDYAWGTPMEDGRISADTLAGKQQKNYYFGFGRFVKLVPLSNTTRNSLTHRLVRPCGKSPTSSPSA